MPEHTHREAVTHIAQAYPDRVEVRGLDLTGDLMGRVTFTEYFHLLLTGREPTEEQRYFLDLLLVAIAEHGMMPTNVAARMTLAADPGSLQGAVAAGILGCGPVILGTAGECARLLERAQERVAGGEEPQAVARRKPVERSDRGERKLKARTGRPPGKQSSGDKKEKKTKATIWVPEQLWEEYKEASWEKRCHIGELVTRALAEYHSRYLRKGKGQADGKME